MPSLPFEEQEVEGLPFEKEESFFSKAGSEILEGAKATGAAVLDLGAGLTKFPLQVGMAALGTGVSGLRPDIAREEAINTVEKWAPSYGHEFGLEKNLGYRIPMLPFELLSKGIESLGTASSDDPRVQGLVKQGLDIGTFLIPGAAKKGYKALTKGEVSDPALSATGKEPGGELPKGEFDPRYEPVLDEAGNRIGLKLRDTPEPKFSSDKPPIEIIGGREEPKMGDLRSPEERVAEAMAMKEKAERQRAGNIEQDQLALPFEETPTYRGGARGGILDQSRLTVDENGIPFDRAASSRYALGDTSPGDVVGRTPEGELTRSPESATRDLFGTARETSIPLEERWQNSRETPPLAAEAVGRSLGEPPVSREVPPSLDLQGRIEPRGLGEWETTLNESPREIEPSKQQLTRKTLRLLKLLGEADKQQYGRQRRGPGGSQGGAINPEIFIEGFEKVKDLSERGLKLIARFVPFERGSKEGYLIVEARNNENKRVAGATFEKSREGYGLEETDLSASNVGVIPEARGNRLSKEIYQFVAEMGNDIVPSQVRTAEGRQMWEKFEQEGLASEGRISGSKELPQELQGEQKLFTADPVQGAKDFIDLLRKNSKNIEDFTDKLVKELGEEMRPIAAALYGQGEKKPETSKKQTSGETPKRNLPKQVEQYMIGDNRPAAQFAKEEKAKGFDKWVDISPWTSIARNFSPLSIVAALNKKSPVINWLHAKITRLDNELFMKKETVKYGTKFAPDWRGFKKHVKSDDGAMTILDSLPKQRKDVVMNTFFDKFEGREIEVNEQVLMDAGMSKREAQGILSARKAFDQALKDFNEWSASVGETPITVRPNYFPHSWRGPYRVFVKNAEGETVAVYGANSWLEGQRIAKGLKNKASGHTIETPALGKSKYNTNDITAYKDAIEFLEKDDPARKILDQTYREILSKRGARKVKLFRKGVEGFDRDVNIVGDYLDKVYNFLYNQKKRAALSDILTELEKEGVKLEKDFPNTHKYMLDATAIATHAVEDGIPAITAALDMVGMAVGQGPYGTRNFIRNMNGVATANFLTTPAFLGANAMQPIFNLPKAMQMKIRPEQAALAYGESYKKSYFPGPYEIEAMNWAVKNGHIQSRVADMLELKTGNPRTWPMKTPYWFANNVIGKVDSQITRIPSFFFYDTILKEAIPNKEARWQQAGLLTQEIMVNYSPSNSPMVFPRLGPVVGPAVRPFTQFFLSYFGQMLMYMGEMKGKPGAKATMAAMAPLITFVAAQAIMGGVNGMIGVRDSNTIIESINAMFGLNIPTMDKMLAQTDISNTILYGPVSTATGLNLSGTVSAPSLINPPAVPGVSLTADIGKNLLNFSSKAAKGELNDADKMLMALAISPRITDAAVTDYFRKEGRGEPNPYQNMEPDIGPETPGAMFGLVQPDNPLQLSDKAARYMSSRTPEQAREKLKIRELKKADLKQKEKRSEYVRLMIDRLDNGKDVDDILPKYMEQNGNMKTLKTELVQGLKERNMVFIQRFIGKSKGLTKAQKLQKLEEFHLLQDKMEDPKALMDTYRELKDAD